jgi:hypothetical protein
VTWQRSLIVLSAVLLIVAFALATAGPLDLPLELMLNRISPTFPTSLRAALPNWMADRIVLPLLLRPAWLVPLSVGLLCACAALTFPTGKPMGRTKLR